MKRILPLFCLTVVLWQLPVLAEEASGHSGTDKSMVGPHETLWKTLNFAILAGFLGYLIGKQAPGLFASRNAQIRKGLDEAAKKTAEAEARTAQISRRLAALESEIGRMRQEASAELEADQQKVRQETERLLEKVNEHARQDIDAAGKAARQELKAYAGGLAVRLAETQIRAQMNADAEDALVSAFADGLGGKRTAEAQ
ncbi:MAG: hypothetical protein IT160_21360 [Bryobacterales bacterium]|nr:hypothetical protein [Bryobacterales bacterium]